MQRLCDAKDKLLEAREAEKQQLEEMLEQRLSDLGISPEQLYDNGTTEEQEMVCGTSYLVIAGSQKMNVSMCFNTLKMLTQHRVITQVS